MSGDLTDLWTRYTAARDTSHERRLRNELIVEYQSLVDHVARQVAVGLTKQVDEGDLKSYGNLGLIDAIEKFQPERNLRFEAYAVDRIRGSIIDELRRTDSVPRSIRAQSRLLRTATAKLQRSLNRQPTTSEIADLLGVSLERIDEMIAADNAAHAEHLSDHEEPIATAGHIAVAVDDDSIEIFSLREALADAIAALPYRERAILALYYREHLSFDDIRVILDVAVGRISQIHTAALRMLRRSLAGPLLDTYLERTS